LGITHNDISPSNIKFAGNVPVVIDFGPCAAEGDGLGLLGGRTTEWHDETVDMAAPKNDLNILQEFDTWLSG
jgi:tRNA A-37 threonylcarbamoyl transferase component Bud32